jgi:hypothetical protein
MARGLSLLEEWVAGALCGNLSGGFAGPVARAAIAPGMARMPEGAENGSYLTFADLPGPSRYWRRAPEAFDALYLFHGLRRRDRLPS